MKSQQQRAWLTFQDLGLNFYKIAKYDIREENI